ncbi:CRISPR-associated helicase Cas3' [Leptospira sp. WS92.C1]
MRAIHFWAKTTSDGNPGISVYQHMLNVGNVASMIAEQNENLLQRFELNIGITAVLAALHDIGKVSPGFQRKCNAWLVENNLEQIAKNGVWDTTMESDHGKVSHAFIQQFLRSKSLDPSTSKYVSAVIGAHHGRLNRPDDRGYRPPKAIVESGTNVSGIVWELERQQEAERIWNVFINRIDKIASLNNASPGLWWLAGLTTVADWIGSDERFFPPLRNLNDHDSVKAAQLALAEIELNITDIFHGKSFKDLFTFDANDLQKRAVDTIVRPGVYIVEAPMGMGKTEAALAAAYQLIAQGLATGIYFALPTQATSNRIYLRLNEFLKNISTNAISRLIHGNSWLVTDKLQIQSAATSNDILSKEDARVSQNWFASNKRALLAPFGVGTIDQALLGVVAAKHFFVRHFALSGKVVILDEVHSYDLYTGTLVNRLIETLEGLGCTIIVLSATLTKSRRGQILPEYEEKYSELKIESYPVITGRVNGQVIEPVAIKPPESKEIEIDFISNKDAEIKVLELAKNGGLILWICNTVSEAQRQYLKFNQITEKQIKVGLLHSRFPIWRREQLESEWMERLGKDENNRRPCILVSTQIVEQSVDLDADLLVTELAPTDMMLQRLGRLWRHKRGNRKKDKPQMLILQEEYSLSELKEMESSEISKAFGRKARVYSPYVLLRSLDVWLGFQNESISIPGQIRQVIEATYTDNYEDPDSWKELKSDLLEKKRVHEQKALMNSNIWQVALEDEEGIQTRLSEIPQVSLVLCKSIKDNIVNFIDGSSHSIPKKKFDLSFAQKIHRNIVKISRYHFKKNASLNHFSDVVQGLCAKVLIPDGPLDQKNITLEELQEGVQFFYSDNLGIIESKIIEEFL